MNTKPLNILISLVVVNTITLYLYFSTDPHKQPQNHPILPENRPILTENHSTLPENHPFLTENHLFIPENHPKLTENLPLHPQNHSKLTENHLPRYPYSVNSGAKPWPKLPSYLPWTQNPNLKPRSCEAYFGNGFTRKFDFLTPAPAFRRKSIWSSGGWFRCLYSETLNSSICEGGRVRMWPEKIEMSRGGEKVETVIGRSDEEEIPVFEDGAFDIETRDRSRRGLKLVNETFLKRYVNNMDIERQTMSQLFRSIRLVSDDEFHCSHWIEEPTLLFTRFEYANVFHTFTDFYSAYVASRVTGLPNRPHLLFVDGHCETQLEEMWQILFSSIKYAKHFSGPVCFRHAIFTPLGYETAMFEGLSETINCHGVSVNDLKQHPDNNGTARLWEFGEMIRASFGFPVDRPRMLKPKSGLNILFVRREDYLAHPRSGGKIEMRLSNEAAVYESVYSWASSLQECKLNVVNGRFAHMPMKDQVRAIQDASVIIGAHGAGLTHIVSARPDTAILEIIASRYNRPHFAFIAGWKGLKYYPIYIKGAHAQTEVVIKKLHDIVRSFDC